MSLINQMLKDLENRQRPQRLSFADSSIAENAVMKSGGMWVFYFFSVILIAFAFSFIIKQGGHYFLHSASKLTKSDVVNTAEKKADIQLADKKSAISSPTKVDPVATPQEKNNFLWENWSLESHPNMTTLHIQFSNDVLYKLDTETGAHRLNLWVDEASLQQVLPDLALAESPIESIDILQTTSPLQVQIQLKPQAELAGLTQDNHTLHLAFSNNSLDEKSDDSSQADIKKVFHPLSREQEAQAQLDEALELVEENAIEEGSNKLEMVVKQFPKFRPARRYLVNLLVEQEQINKAMLVLAEGIQKDPSYYPFARMEAQLLINEGKNQQALNVLLAHAPELEDSPNYYALLAAAYKNNHQYQPAVQVYSQLLKAHPENSVWWVGLAVCLESLNKNNEALHAYRKALKIGDLQAHLQAYVAGRISDLA